MTLEEETEKLHAKLEEDIMELRSMPPGKERKLWSIIQQGNATITQSQDKKMR